MVFPRRAIAVLLLISLGTIPVFAAEDAFTTAANLYSRSVDLANEGRYAEALAAADSALALNVSSFTALIQTNRAGILNMLGRYDEAITAADSALLVSENLTTTRAIAYYNKGDALRNLGRTEEARAAFAQASELDPTLVPPVLTAGPIKTRTMVTAATTERSPAPTKSPVPPALVVFSCLAGFACSHWSRTKT